MEDINIIDAEQDFGVIARSSVKLIKNTKGVNWEIKVVKGEDHLLAGMKETAIKIHKEIMSEVEA